MVNFKLRHYPFPYDVLAMQFLDLVLGDERSGAIVKAFNRSG